MEASIGFLAAVAPIMSLVGGVVGAVGSIAQGESMSKMYGAEASIAAQNSIAAQQNAAWKFAEGESNATMAGLRGRQQVGAVKAAQAASGLDVNVGSAPDVVKSQEAMNLYNQLQIKSNAARQAYGYQVEATGFQNQAALDRSAASNARTASYFGAAGSLLGGASSAGSQYAMWNLINPANPLGGGSGAGAAGTFTGLALV